MPDQIAPPPVAAGFAPVLLRVEASADYLVPGDDLWITSWWQNAGRAPSSEPLLGFLEMEFGHQRMPETNPRQHRLYWEPFPGTHTWRQGDIWKTTCRWRVPPLWGGTYRLYLGLCDAVEHAPVEVRGEGGRPHRRVFVGEVELSWGWGTPTVETTRRPWSWELNPPLTVPGGREPAAPQAIEIGDGVRARLAADCPALLSIGDGETSFAFPPGPVEIVLRHRPTDSLLHSYDRGVMVTYRSETRGRCAVSYRAEVRRGGEPLATFGLAFEASRRGLRLTLEGVEERPGYELLEIHAPALVSSAHPTTHLVDFYMGGRLISLEKALPMAYVHPYDARNALAMCTDAGTIVLESRSLDDRVSIAVQESASEKRAALGVALVNRVRARGELASIPVPLTHSVEIGLLSEEWGPPSWQAVARFLRRGLQGKNRHLYRRALFCKMLGTAGPPPPAGRVREDSPYAVRRLVTEVMTFREMLAQVRRLSILCDGVPQVAYIVGFQKGGSDANYPHMLETDPRCGTVEELRQVIQEARQYNAVLAHHDNLDDMTAHNNPYLDPRIVALDAEGRYWKGWIWAGGLSYIISPHKYARTGLMQARVRETVQRYGLHTSDHIDVLSSEPLRYDYDPACPASAETSHQGKLAIIAEFNRLGVDITSESLTHPFVGHIGFALWPRESRDDVLFHDDRYVPLVSMVYHGTIGYCGPSGSKREMLKGLEMGAYAFLEIPVTGQGIRWFYLQTLVAGLLYDKAIQDHRQDGEVVTVTYDDRTCVRLDYDRLDYEVVVDGRPVARDWTTFAPGFREGVYLAYSWPGGTMRYPAPPGWHEATHLRAVALTEEGEGEPVRCLVGDGLVELDMPADTPVRVERAGLSTDPGSGGSNVPGQDAPRADPRGS
jgi:hypothetical protein